MDTLPGKRLMMYYQPVVSMRDDVAPRHGVVGVEALIRMAHPQRGILAPVAFAEALDHPRLARRIGCFVLDAALAQGESWHHDGLPLRVSVNISVRHLLDPEFPNDLRAALSAHPGMAPEFCEVEVTESVPILDFRHARETLLNCNRLGVRIALDDFGTGGSSLTYLQKLPAQTIKVDQSFVRNVILHQRDQAIVAGVMKIADALGLNVVAEGVETVDQLQLLDTLGCHAMQGYLFARPMPASDMPTWVDHFTSIGELTTKMVEQGVRIG